MAQRKKSNVKFFHILLIFCGFVFCTNGEECCLKDTGGSGRCLDGTAPTPYCGYGKCNRFGCNCLGGCRVPRNQTECCLHEIPTHGYQEFKGGYCRAIVDLNSGYCMTSECQRNICNCSKGCRFTAKALWEAQLFEEKDYNNELGLVWANDFSICVELSSGPFERGQASSIVSLENCVILFSKPECKGESSWISNNVNDLGELNFNKKARSICSCEKQLDCCKPGKDGMCRDGYEPTDGHCGHGSCDKNGCNCVGGCKIRSYPGSFWSANLFSAKRFHQELGIVWGENVSSCVDLNFGPFKDEYVSSVNSLGNCVSLYPQFNCTGDKVEIYPGSSYHGDLWTFDDKARSISYCLYPGPIITLELVNTPVNISNATSVIMSDFAITSNISQGKEEVFKSSSLMLILFVPSMSIFLIFVSALFAYIICSKRLFRKINKNLEDKSIQNEIIELIENDNDNYIWYENYRGLKIPKSDIDFDGARYLDSGNFGLVQLAKYRGSTPVVIKSTRKSRDLEQFEILLEELKILSSLPSHQNIVGFIGASIDEIHKRSIHIVVEYCPLGSLEKYLNTHKNLFKDLFSKNVSNYSGVIDTTDLIRWSLQIANAMVFLEESNIIHGDLATRNILLSTKDCVKITDFGLSKKLYNYIGNRVYHMKKDKPLPTAWLAIETLLENKLSTESDVWAYGITLWEIFSIGKTPYEDLINTHNTEKFGEKLKKGLWLKKPKFSNEKIYGEMYKCWNKYPGERPSFQNLRTFFHEILNGELTKAENQTNENKFLKFFKCHKV